MFDLRFCDGLCIFYTQGLINWKLNFYLCDICSLEHDAIASIGGKNTGYSEEAEVLMNTIQIQTRVINVR